MFTLCRQDCLVSIDGFTFDLEDNVSKRGVVYDLPHIENQRIDSFVVNFVFLKLANVQDTNVVEPLAPIKASKNKKLLHADDTSGVALSAGGGFLTFVLPVLQMA